MIPLVEKCEVGGQWIFVRNSCQITIRRDTKTGHKESNHRNIKKRRGSCRGFEKILKRFQDIRSEAGTERGNKASS